MVPVYKKGDRNDVANYRGITLMDANYKIYAEILRNRLEKEIEEKNVLQETQMGFRRRRGAMDAVMLLNKLIEEEKKRQKRKDIRVLCRPQRSLR